MAFSWHDLPRPIVGLSAMDGVTDCAMREITNEIGDPDFMVTEFTSSDGLAYGVRKLLRDFAYTPEQRPIIAQIFGANPEKFYSAAVICCFLGFDGIDINMGCPADSATKKGGGAALIKEPELAKSIVRHVQRAVTDYVHGIALSDLHLPAEFQKLIELSSQKLHPIPRDLSPRFPLPVSVKTRIGYEKPVTLEWIKHLLEVSPAVITLHGRTLEQHYSGEASWEEITRASDYVHAQTTTTLLFGNGDLNSPQKIVEKVRDSNVDGVWIGRAAMGNPWIFSQYRDYVSRGSYDEPSWEERKAALLRHYELFEEYNRTLFADDPYPTLNMRKHLGWYVRGIPDASALRQRLFLTHSLAEVRVILDSV